MLDKVVELVWRALASRAPGAAGRDKGSEPWNAGHPQAKVGWEQQPCPWRSFSLVSVPHGHGLSPFCPCSKGHEGRPEELGTLGTRLHPLLPLIKSPQDSKEGQDAAGRG